MVYNCESIAMNMTDQLHYGAADTFGRDHLAHLIFKLKKKHIRIISPTKPDNVEDNDTDATDKNDVIILKVLNSNGEVIEMDNNIKKVIVSSPEQVIAPKPELHKLHPVAKDVLKQINIRYRRITSAEYKENKKTRIQKVI